MCIVPDPFGKFGLLVAIQSVIHLCCSSCWRFSRVIVRVPGGDPCLNLVGSTRVDNLKKFVFLEFKANLIRGYSFRSNWLKFGPDTS